MVASKEQQCPYCGSYNVTKRKNDKKERPTQQRMSLFMCLDCKVSWFRVTSIGKN
jgi:transposase-like protein